MYELGWVLEEVMLFQWVSFSQCRIIVIIMIGEEIPARIAAVVQGGDDVFQVIAKVDSR